MPNYISSKRLKKKVLDRWENEGGKLVVVPSKKTVIVTPKKRQGKIKISKFYRTIPAELN